MFLRMLFTFRKLIITGILIAGFFSAYNMFLINHAFEILESSLEQIALINNLDTVDMSISSCAVFSRYVEVQQFPGCIPIYSLIRNYV